MSILSQSCILINSTLNLNISPAYIKNKLLSLLKLSFIQIEVYRFTNRLINKKYCYQYFYNEVKPDEIVQIIAYEIEV